MCVYVYAYVKDMCFSVYCYLYILMYFLFQDGSSKLSLSLVSLFKGMHAALCLCVCMRKMFSDLTLKLKYFNIVIHVGFMLQLISSLSLL